MMITMTNPGIHTYAGTGGGIFLGWFLQVHNVVADTIIVHGLGAAVSFGVSLGLRELYLWLKRHKNS
jgi:hypothetical protein